MKECFVLRSIEIKNSNFCCSEPLFKVRVNFCIVDEHGFESATGREEKVCSTWTDVEDFISRWK